jgi:hypothetical protein
MAPQWLFPSMIDRLAATPPYFYGACAASLSNTATLPCAYVAAQHYKSEVFDVYFGT